MRVACWKSLPESKDAHELLDICSSVLACLCRIQPFLGWFCQMLSRLEPVLVFMLNANRVRCRVVCKTSRGSKSSRTSCNTLLQWCHACSCAAVLRSSTTSSKRSFSNCRVSQKGVHGFCVVVSRPRKSCKAGTGHFSERLSPNSSGVSRSVFPSKVSVAALS